MKIPGGGGGGGLPGSS